MKKTILSVICACFLVVSSVMPAFAIEGSTNRLKPRFVDGANFLNDEDADILLQILDDNSEAYEAELVVVTTDSFGGKTAVQFAEKFYNDNLYGFSENRDGVILAVSKSENTWGVAPYGYMVNAYATQGYERMNKEYKSYFDEGDYYNAFSEFAMMSSEIAFSELTEGQVELITDENQNYSNDATVSDKSNNAQSSAGTNSNNSDENAESENNLSTEQESIIPSEAIKPRLVDDANLLTDIEKKDLLTMLDEISERQKLDVVVVTVNSLDGKTATEYADDFYDYNGYGYGESRDGILLLVSMEDRDWAMSTCGYAIQVFTDAGLKYMENEFVGFLSSGDYMTAFTTFAELCDDYITEARTNKPYDTNNKRKVSSGSVFQYVIISIVVGSVVAAILMIIPLSKMKSVRKQAGAGNYVRNGSMVVTNSNEYFLYSNVTKTKIESSSSGGGSSTHTSSSGTSHGGSSGKF